MSVNKIERLKVKNFMSIRDADITFDDTNIITLCGYNDSGKSAVTRLMEIMFYNAYPSEQVKFITDGEDFWEGELVFTDGVSIKRIKYSDGKSEFEMKKDGRVLFTNRLDNGTFAAMGDIPEKIKEYLGVIQDEFTEEKLNVRRNTDKLFLITTTGGENYKILNSVLQSDMLAETSKRITEDKNKLKGEVVTLETKKDVIGEQVANKQILPEEVERETKEKLEKVIEDSSKLSRVGSIAELKGNLESIVVYDEVKPLDMAEFNILSGIATAFNYTNVNIQPEVAVADTKRIESLLNIVELQKVALIPMYEEVNRVEIGQFETLMDIGTKYSALYETTVQLNETTKELKKVRAELDKLSKEHGFKLCGNCGSVVE